MCAALGAIEAAGSGTEFASILALAAAGRSAAAPDMSARTRQENEQVRKNIEKKLWDMSNPYRR